MAPLLRYLQTIRHLRPRQVWYRLWRPLQKRFYKEKAAPGEAIRTALNRPQQGLQSFRPHDIYDPSAHAFTLLNLSAAYPQAVNWNDDRHGALWAFHLNYFGWLEDERLSTDARFGTIREYVAAQDEIAVGLSAYTISLRSIAWIRFFLRHGVAEASALRLLYRHLARLYHFPEYEIDGNHLWENGCALLAGGLYFEEAAFYKQGLAILQEAIRDQLADDGMHLEASPMYHSLLLQRLLICLELSGKLQPDEAAPAFLRDAAAKMLGWLAGFAFKGGAWAMVNDAAPGVAPSLEELTDFAAGLGIHAKPLAPQSHYRVYRNDVFELVMDVGNITPPWQPGHHHADALSFCLNSSSSPVIVDAGISAYRPSALRDFQRSTNAHNTVSVAGRSSSDVWKSFRIGRRAKVRILHEGPADISAEHDGYGVYGICHRRNISFGVDKIIIEDQLKGLKRQKAFLHLHFHPDIQIKKIGENEYGTQDLRIMFKGTLSVGVESYTFAPELNDTREASRLVIAVTAYTTTTIERITTTNAD